MLDITFTRFTFTIANNDSPGYSDISRGIFARQLSESRVSMKSRLASLATSAALCVGIAGAAALSGGGVASAAPERFDLHCFANRGDNYTRYVYLGGRTQTGTSVSITDAYLSIDHWQADTWVHYRFGGYVKQVSVPNGSPNFVCAYLNLDLNVPNFQYGYFV